MSTTAIIERQEESGAVEQFGALAGNGAGLMAMAQMDEGEFKSRMMFLKRGRERIELIKRELMRKDVDYGVIPGTDKPTLLKPGAEALCNIYGLRPNFIPDVRYGDGVTSPPVTVIMRSEFHLGDITGPVVAVGYGAANSWEKRYRYRRGERACPECGVAGSVIKGKEEFGGGWLCWSKKGGCGAKFAANDAQITQQAVGDIENPDPFDLLNTLVKISGKRSHIDGSLRATGSSSLFSQDLEEMGGEEEASARTAPQQQKAARQSTPPAAAPKSAPAAQQPAATGANPLADKIVVTATEIAKYSSQSVEEIIRLASKFGENNGFGDPYHPRVTDKWRTPTLKKLQERLDIVIRTSEPGVAEDAELFTDSQDGAR